MAAANAATAKAVERLGMGMIAPDQGVGAIQALLLLRGGAALPAVTAAVPFRWGRFIQRLGAGAVPPMFEAFAAEAAAEAPLPEAAPAAVADDSDAEIEEGSSGRRRRQAAAPASRRRGAARRPAKAPAAATAAAAPDAAAHKEYMVAQVQAAVSSVLGSTVGLEDPLMAAGLDSLGSGGWMGGGWAAFDELLT